MTLSALKEVLRDRIALLESVIHDGDTAPPSWLPQGAEDQSYRRGRLEELRVCLSLVEKLDVDPLVDAKNKAESRSRWGEQPRGDWPNSSFSGAPYPASHHDYDDRFEYERCKDRGTHNERNGHCVECGFDRSDFEDIDFSEIQDGIG